MPAIEGYAATSAVRPPEGTKRPEAKKDVKESPSADTDNERVERSAGLAQDSDDAVQVSLSREATAPLGD